MNAFLRFTGLATLLAAAAVMTGCATSGRYIVLKDYSSPRSSEENSPLKGRTVCVKPFVDAFNINEQLPDKNAIEPANYTYTKMSGEETRQWDNEVRNLRNSSATGRAEIGYVRNGFGAVMSKVVALTDPGAWLTDNLKADLQKLGARVVEPAQAADAEITVGGAIKYFKIDIYTAYWADLVVDVQLKPRTQETTTRTIHTKAGQIAWSSSSYEYFQSLRQCQQKFSRLLIADMEKLPKDDPSVKTYEEIQKAPEPRVNQEAPQAAKNLTYDANAPLPFAGAEPGEIVRILKVLRNPEFSAVVPAILPLLHHESPNVVRDTCRTLAVIANKDVVSFIQPLLNDKREPVRKDAQDAIDVLNSGHRLDSSAHPTQRAAVLGSLDPKDIVRMLKLLRSPEFAPVVPAILPLLHNESANVLRDACRTLAVIANKDVIPNIEPLLNDNRENVRKDAQDAIDKLRAKP